MGGKDETVSDVMSKLMHEVGFTITYEELVSRVQSVMHIGPEVFVTLSRQQQQHQVTI